MAKQANAVIAPAAQSSPIPGASSSRKAVIPNTAPTRATDVAWVLYAVAHGFQIADADVALIMRVRGFSMGDRKALLTELHSRGLVDDDQMTRAFEAQPALARA